jgi:hypothetical protein
MMTTTNFGEANQRRQRLLQTITAQPDDSACSACVAKLDEYVAAQLRGEDYLQTYADVARHLDSCLDCANAYALLYDLELAGATLPQPDQLPQPDLSFLEPAIANTTASPTFGEKLRAALEQTVGGFELQLSPAFFAGLAPQPAFSALRGSDESQRYGERLFSLDPDEESTATFPLMLAAYRDNANRDLCLLEVTTTPPGRSWPELEGIQVTLHAENNTWKGHTDAWGLASFEGIPLALLDQLLIEVVL